MMDNDAPLSGEARLKAKRAAFFRYLALGVLAGFLAGLMSGVAAAMVEAGHLPIAVLIVLWGATMALLVWYCRDYFRRVDELDLMDNLWASTVGLYGYFMVFGTWYLFNDIGLAPEPDQLLVMFATLAITGAAYCVRKLGLR